MKIINCFTKTKTNNKHLIRSMIWSLFKNKIVENPNLNYDFRKIQIIRRKHADITHFAQSRNHFKRPSSDKAFNLLQIDY